MGLLRELTASQPSGSAADASFLRDLISAVVTSDGNVDVAEHLTVEALFETIPQLRSAPTSERPPATGRKALLAQMKKVTSTALRRQLFVIAVDLALSSDGASEREDAFVEELKQALSIDDAFAKSAITIVACKYGRAR